MLTPILGGEVDDRETDNVNGSAQVRSLKSRRGDLTETVGRLLLPGAQSQAALLWNCH